MFRNLRAIEIAEGALLADIAVAIQFLVAFFPVGAHFFVFLNFTIFAILVLRRGLYVGCVGVCVAVFLLCVFIGPHSLISMVTEGLGGLFLGFTMKRRFRHLPVVLLGSVGGTVYSYLVLMGLLVLTGTLQATQQGLHTMYAGAVVAISFVARLVGLGTVWQQHLLPFIDPIANWALAYWWATSLVGLFLIFIPIVAAIYAISNTLVRLLGYEVRPVMAGKRMRRLRWRLLKARVRRIRGHRRRHNGSETMDNESEEMENATVY